MRFRIRTFILVAMALLGTTAAAKDADPCAPALRQAEEGKILEAVRAVWQKSGVDEPILVCMGSLKQIRTLSRVGRHERTGQLVLLVDDEVSTLTATELLGWFGHELSHELLGHTRRKKPAAFEEQLAEEQAADLKATQLVGRPAVEKAVDALYRLNVRLGLSSVPVNQRFRGLRLDWIRQGQVASRE